MHKSYYSTYPSNQFDTCYYGGPPTMTYHGGPVISNVRVYSVLWTANVDPNVTAQIGNFYGDITTSPYQDALSAYATYASAEDGGSSTAQSINEGTYGGQYTIAPESCNTSDACMLSDDQIKGELQVQIMAGNLPQPTMGAEGQINSLYMIEFPANVTIVQSNGDVSCADFCAYHDFVSVNGTLVPYGVFPDIEDALPDGSYNPCTAPSRCTTSASQPADFNAMTTVHSHELGEAVTNPFSSVVNTTSDSGKPLFNYVRPSAWGADANCGEIGDYCIGQESQSIGNGNGRFWAVQPLWSSVGNVCAASPMWD